MMYYKDFELVNKNTKKEKQLQEIEPRYSSLWECYNNFSRSKENALEYCHNLQSKYNGFNGGIVSYNIMQFTYTFEFKEDGKHYKAYITKVHNYLVEL